jgi:hypothetical protein
VADLSPEDKARFDDLLAKAKQQAEFLRVVGEHRELTENERFWLDVGLTCGVAVGMDEVSKDIIKALAEEDDG